MGGKAQLASALLLFLGSMAAAAAPGPPGDIAGEREPLAGLDLPVGRDGVPTRALTDAELFRLLVALSSRLPAATERLAVCHAQGRPYGAPGWRACIEGR